jgi:Cd2+/Zn2+-exporting ATPase
VVKFGVALLALTGFVTLWVVVAVGDMGLSLAVILNALRLGRIRPERA